VALVIIGRKRLIWQELGNRMYNTVHIV